MSSIMRQRLGWAVVIASIIADRVIKYYLTQHPAFTADAGFLSLERSINYNLALSLPTPLPSWALAGVMVGLTVLIGIYAYRHRANRLLLISAGAIMVGAWSNAYDRLVVGGVVDYLSVANLTTLNLADVLITVGCLGLFVSGYKKLPA